jgi:hypothetical protein
MEPTIVMLAIAAGLGLGRKLNEVLVDETQERALMIAQSR